MKFPSYQGQFLFEMRTDMNLSYRKGDKAVLVEEIFA
jgi:hypothetical protein